MSAYNKLNEFWLRYKKNKMAVGGLIILIFLTLVTLLAPLISQHDPFNLDATATFRPPSVEYLMGTDDLGRDVFTRLLYGNRVSLFIGVTAAVASTCIGILVGAISGYYGGKFDDLLMRLTEMFQVIPRFFLLLIMVAILGSRLSNIIITIAILSWPSTARLLRAEFIQLRESQFVEAAKALGDKDRNIIFSEILPNALAPIIVSTSFQISNAILTEAGLSFLGLGDPDVVSWGIMLYRGREFIERAAWMTLFPGLALFLASLGFNVVGDGLNDALNPKLKKR